MMISKLLTTRSNAAGHVRRSLPIEAASLAEEP
jgi:hypothetical protein